MTNGQYRRVEPPRTTPSTAADLADDLWRPSDRIRVQVGIPHGEGWIALAQLLTPDEIASACTRIEEDNGVRRTAPGMWLATFVAAAVAAPLVRAHRRRGVLLDVPLMSLYVHRDGGGPYDAVAVPPDAPVRELPENERAARIGAVVARDLAPLVDGIRRRGRVARKALWGSVADGVAAEYLSMVRAGVDDRHALVADLAAVLDAASPPVSARPTCSELEGVPVPTRAVCCNAHRGAPGRCSTCPDLKPRERLERMQRDADGLFGEGSSV